MAVRKKTARKKTDSFYKTFIGEFVDVMGEFSMPMMDGSLASVKGFLLDTDNEFLYLGTTADAVNAAIRREKIFTIQVIQPKSRLEKMLEDFEGPSDIEGFN